MAASRESIMSALLTLLSSTGDFVTISRRNSNPEGLDPTKCPALFLIEHSETYTRRSPSLPAVRHLNVKAILYNDVGQSENAIPSTLINNALDELDAILTPSGGSGLFTLTGLVYSLTIDGSVEKAPGDITGKSLAIIPLRIELP